MITGKIIRSAGFMGVSQLVCRLCDLAALAVAARFLTPADFGLVAIATATLVLANSITELPIGETLIQKGELTRDVLETAFTINAIRGAAIASVLCLIAWPIAFLFEEPRLFPVLCVVALAPLLQGWASPNLLRTMQAVNYRPQAFCLLFGKLSSSFLLVVLAWTTGSFWALVIASVAHQVISALSTHLFSPFRPRFSLFRAKEIISVASWVSAARILSVVNQQGERFFVGAFLGKPQLGKFTMAGDISGLATYSIINPLLSPLFAGLAQFKDDVSRQARAFLMGQQLLAIAVVPLGFGLALVAEEVVPLLLGDQWIGMEPLVWCLAPAIAIHSLTVPMSSLAMARANPERMFAGELFNVSVRIPASIAGAWFFGIYGLAIAWTLVVPLTVMFNFFQVRKMINLHVIEQLRVLIRPLFAATVMMGVVLYLKHHFADQDTPLNALLELGVLITAGALSYAAALLTHWHATGRSEGAESWVLEGLKGILGKAKFGLSRRLAQ
jgi:PST family polysaccharide transporter